MGSMAGKAPDAAWGTERSAYPHFCHIAAEVSPQQFERLGMDLIDINIESGGGVKVCQALLKVSWLQNSDVPVIIVIGTGVR